MRTATLMYSIICDDIRLEMGNKLSLMGVFQNIFVPTFPSTLVKFAVVNHWEGEGRFETQVKILLPDRRELVASAPSQFTIEKQGYADNVTFFTNVTFDRAGTYTVYIYLDGNPVEERNLYVHQVSPPPQTVH